MNKSNPWERAKNQLGEAVETLSIDPLLTASLAAPDRIVEVSIPIGIDDDIVQTFTGYRVQHNNIRGLYGAPRAEPVVFLVSG